MAVPWQARDNDVVTTLVELVGKANKLLRAGRNPVKKDDRDRPRLPVEQQLGAAFVRNTAVVAEPEPIEQRARLVG